MRPDEQQSGRFAKPLVPQRPFLRAPRDTDRVASQNAAAQVVRTQLDAIYAGTNDATPQPMTAPLQTPTAETNLKPDNTTYARTHSDASVTQASQWEQYHSAWQEYYQKYYERYYIGQIHEAKRDLEQQASEAASKNTPVPVFSSTSNLDKHQTSAADGTLSKQDAIHELRSKLLDNVKSAAIKARGSRHFVPISAALGVMIVFLFLQYNRVLIANVKAYVTPGNIEPQNIIVDPTTQQTVSAEARLIIPKINVDVPVIYGVGADHNSQMSAMEHGVAHFSIPGANSVPGQVGNTVLSGHSSNDVLDSGEYKFIFAQLDKLQDGDTIYVNYQSKRYTYVITRKEVVKPTEVGKLIYPTDKPILTLITCTPLGTSTNRLLVTAEQVSPDPAAATAAPASTGSETVAMPGNSPTFVERLFGN